jgi:CBS domain-containing protein
MQARDIMTTNVVSVEADTPIEEIAKLLLENRISAVPVTDTGGRVLGIVSEGDLMRRPESGTERPPSWWLVMLSSSEQRAASYLKSHGKLAKDVMSEDVVAVDENAALEDVADILEKHRIKRVPVLRDNKLVGIVSRANLLHGLVTAKVARRSTSEDETMRASVIGAIRKDAGVLDRFVNVTVADGTVHLWGSVESETERKAVHAAAENTDGVRAVDDHLGVIPPQTSAIMWED